MRGMNPEQWRQLMQYNPWHFWQWSNSLVPLSSDCNTLVRAYGWQDADRAGRDQIVNAINRAETLMHDYAHFWPTPRPFSETQIYPIQPSLFQYPRITLEHKYVQALGTEQETDSATEAIVYTDEDGDGLVDTATLTATVTAGTLPSEIVVRFLAADCGPVAISELPLRSVAVSGVNATITINAWACARPIRYQGRGGVALNPSDVPPSATSPYATSATVLRRRCDPTGTSAATVMITAEYDTNPAPWGSGCCSNPGNPSSNDPAATATVLARGTIIDSRAGIVAFGEATYNTTTGTWYQNCIDWCRYPPNRVTVNGYAGFPLNGIAIDDRWAQVIGRLAGAELARPICACTSANKELYEWQTDLSRTGATNELFAAPSDMTNPLGSRRGQIYAWRSFQNEQVSTGIFAG